MQQETTIPSAEYELCSKIEPYDFSGIKPPFPEDEIVDVADQRWSVSRVQLDQRRGHTTYVAQSGESIQWKERRGIYDPFYECVTNGLSNEIGLAVPPTTAGFNVASNGSVAIGTMSLIAFAPTATRTLASFSDEKKLLFFNSCNPTLLIAETVNSFWWRNGDFHGGQVVLGALGGNYYYYVVDRDRIFEGFSGGLDPIKDFDPEGAIWPRKYLEIDFGKCLPFVEKIEGLSDAIITRSCFVWADRLGAIDGENSNNYLSMARRFSKWLIENKMLLRSQLGLFFAGAKWGNV